MTVFNFDMHRIGRTIARLQQDRSINDLLPFVGARLLTRLAESTSSKD